MRYPFLLTLSLLLSFPPAALAQDYATTRKSIQGFYGFSVNSFSGNLHYSRTDLFVPGRGLSLDFTFYYNSSESSDNFGSGLGWSHSYDMTMSEDSMGVITLRRAGGRSHQYTRVGGDIVSAQGVYDEVDEPSPGVFRLTSKNGMEYHFEGVSHPGVTRIRDRFGNEMTLSYEDGHLASVTDVGGRTVALTYNDDGLVTEIRMVNTDPERWVYYGYEGEYLTSVTDAEGYQLIYGYTGGRLTSMQDKNGNPLNIGYSPYGAVTAMRTCSGEKKFDYNSTLSTTSVVEKVRDTYQKTSYVFENGRLIEEIGNCCGRRSRYEYDADGNVSRVINANGDETLYFYDERGNVIQEINALGDSRFFTYDLMTGELTSETDWKGNMTQLYYDESGRLDSVLRPLGVREIFQHDSWGQMVTYQSPNGGVFQYQYDSSGNLVSEIDPLGGTRTWMYDDLGQSVQVIDADGNQFSTEFDLTGRIVEQMHPNGSVTFEYDGNGNLIRVLDELGVPEYVGYDEFNRLEFSLDSLGHVQLWEYDVRGNLLFTMDKNGYKERFEYDELNNLVALYGDYKDPEFFEYDNVGNLTAYTGSSDDRIEMEYDGLNRRVAVLRDSQVHMQWEYDANSNLIALNTVDGVQMNYAYDAMDRQVSESLHQNVLREYEYDLEGNLTSLKAGRTQVSWVYDALGRVIESVDTLGATMSYAYSPGGDLISLLDGLQSETSFVTDWRGNTLSKVDGAGAVVTYGYDGRGQLISETYNSGDFVNYEYDVIGRLTRQIASDSTFVSFEYSSGDHMSVCRTNNDTLLFQSRSDGVLLAEVGLNGAVQYDLQSDSRLHKTFYPGGRVVSRVYDMVGSLERVDVDDESIAVFSRNNGVGQAVSTVFPTMNRSFSYAFDGFGGMLSMESDDLLLQYVRDENGKVLEEVGLGVIGVTGSYDYDDVGRILRKELFEDTTGDQALQHFESWVWADDGSPSSKVMGEDSTLFLLGPNSRLAGSVLAGSSLNFSYDDRGSLVSDGLREYGYDGFGRLREVVMGADTVNVTYDGLGRVIEQSYSTGISRRYLYDGYRPIAIYDEQGPVCEMIYDEAGRIISYVVGEEEFFVVYDGTGNPRLFFDGSGSIVGELLFSAFGEGLYGEEDLAETLGVLVVDLPGFQGKMRRLDGVGYFNNARHYSADLGRFYQLDPLGYGDGVNMYAYAHNDGVNNGDFTGLSCDCPNPNNSVSDAKKMFDVMSDTYQTNVGLTETMSKMMEKSAIRDAQRKSRPPIFRSRPNSLGPNPYNLSVKNQKQLQKQLKAAKALGKSASKILKKFPPVALAGNVVDIVNKKSVTPSDIVNVTINAVGTAMLFPAAAAVITAAGAKLGFIATGTLIAVGVYGVVGLVGDFSGAYDLGGWVDETVMSAFNSNNKTDVFNWCK